MIISYFNCKFFGLLSIESKDINYLFSHRNKEFSSIFKLSKKKFNIIKKFKIKRGGFLLEIKFQRKLLALFSITKCLSNSYELGDLLKIDKNLPRSSLAKAINLSCNYIINKNKNNLIYTYPNHFAKRVFTSAGFKIFCLYKRAIYFSFKNFFFLLPFQIFLRKIYLYKNYFNQKKVLNNLHIAPTRNSILGIRIFRKLLPNEKKKKIQSSFGFLYEFKKDRYQGDCCFVFNLKKKKFNFGFEYSDNSF